MAIEADSDGRECARGHHCLRSWVDEASYRRGDWGPRPFCHACRGRIADALEQLPELYAWLWLQLPQSTARPWDRTAARGREAPLPIRVDIDALMRQIYDVLASWEERVRTVAHLTQATRGPHPRERALTQIVRLLGAHLDAVIALDPAPMTRRITSMSDMVAGTLIAHHDTGDHIRVTTMLDGADAGLEILHLHTRARAQAGHTRQVTPLAGVPCPHCDLCALVRVAGEANPQCRGCGTTLPEEDYRRWTRHSAHQAQHGS